ncbi:dynamin family protein [Planococcus citreus]|uniref:dynamin family protein n=1 Tax=Planococcus citreus TaxID=1373 RepID=UPI0010813C6D|nr:dynamin family protein [Planococcus citreus]
MTEKERIIKGMNKWILLNDKDHYADFHKKLNSIKEDFEDRLMIMVSGEFNAGKSTFINAILGEELLTVDITPATAMITKLTYGDQKRVIAHYTNGSQEEFDWSWIENLTAEREGEGECIRQQLSYVEYQLPSDFLKKFTLIDSPGLTALHSHHTAVTERFMKRNEVGIWLFNAMSVGTASELEWLKKMRALNIPTYGVVNAIDRLDEEEDLDQFLEYNERRLYPLINKLYGVSAQEILKGKMERNAELLDWGNAQAIDELLKDIGSVEERKIDSFYRKLVPVLEEFREIHKGVKSSLLFVGDSQSYRIFNEISYPSFLKEQKAYEKSLRQVEKERAAWSDLLMVISISSAK